MKKSLLIAAVAMAMGVGIGAQAAVTNATYAEWSFEGQTQGAVIPVDGMTQAGYGSWSASSNDTDFSYITNVTPDGVTFPIAGTHNQAVYFNGGITNHFESGTAGLHNQRFTTEFLLKPGQLDDPSSIGALDSNARMAFFFNTASNFVLMHGNAGNWQSTTNVADSFPADAWLRITIDQNYATVDENYSRKYFSISINGSVLTNANAYSYSVENGYEPGGADPKWFQMKAFGDAGNFGMNALVGMGMGILDDVVNKPYSEEAPPATRSITVLAANAAWGSITPAGTVVIVENTSSNFDVSVKSGVQAHLATLQVIDGVTITNTTAENLTSATWQVPYSQVLNGSTVTVTFVANDGTTTKFMSSAFPGIGLGSGVGSEYATFQIAATNDPDADGFNNESEAAAGTLPYDNTSYLKIGNITVSAAGQVTVSFLGSTSGSTSNYVLKANDAVTGTYTNVAERAKDADATLSVNDTPAVSPKFYKITLPYTPIAQP